MKKIIKYLSLLLFSFCVGCNRNKTNNVFQNDTIRASEQKDPISSKDSCEAIGSYKMCADDSLDCIHKIKLSNGVQRIFYHVQYEYRHQLYTKIRNDKSVPPKRIMTPYNYCDEGDFYAEGLTDPFSYTISPNGKNLFIVGRVPANSDGWIYAYQLFKVDCNSLKEEFITEGAAIKSTKDGIIVANARLREGDEFKTNGEKVWLIHDELYDYNGKLVSKSSKEYSEQEMYKRFTSSSNEYRYVRNFKEIYCQE